MKSPHRQMSVGVNLRAEGPKARLNAPGGERDGAEQE